MSNEYDYLNPFRSPDGSWTRESSENAGKMEREKSWQHAPQQSHESHEDFMSRVNQNR